MADRRADEPEQAGDIAAVKGRLNELCIDDWASKITRMARDLHLPQPALWKILRGDQPPNAQLFMALASHTTVNVHWVITGRGPHHLEGKAGVVRGDAVARPHVPVAREFLPGPWRQYPGLLDEAAVDPLAILTPTQYWVRVRKTDPVIHIKDEELAPGDWLLFETDPVRFPPADELDYRLVVIPGAVRGVKGPRLARVESVEGEMVTVDTFDLGRIDPSQVEEEIVVRELPGGNYHAFRRLVRKAQPGKGGKKGTPRRPLRPDEEEYIPLDLKYGDLLAVCVLSIRPR
jgi:hypothetical protein